ncbi:unnamed protein product [Lasius platythorax]|uniref:Uncharacterized protein n=1 Tax=Lasius platythorax TaxID=488582 RepID=A0AAV2NDY7_9HYME
MTNLWQEQGKVCSGTTRRKIHANNRASFAVHGVMANLWQEQGKVCSGTTRRKIHANNRANLAVHGVITL